MRRGLVEYGLGVRQVTLAAAAALHLMLVGFGAAGRVPVGETTVIGRVIGVYRAWTGADNAYGFFAPGVAAERRVALHVYAEDRWFLVHERFDTREADLRLSTLAGLFQEDDLRQLLAASWAARALGSFPAARVALVEVQAYVVPTMEQYRGGAQPRWITERVFSFARTPAAG
ncbi:MAG TPA: hypothetical protein VF121_16255 [Thermoanaerobaculia bacterium]|nr:hypothetical protein [Thermoanaerobaculia bacterium]